MALGPFIPTLVNNTNIGDLWVFGMERGNPVNTFDTVFWGCIAQTFLFGLIVFSATRYYWKYIGKDEWMNVGLVTILLGLTVADFIHHQLIAYSIIRNVSSLTGQGMASQYRPFLTEFFIESFFISFGQLFTLAYFTVRAWKLWGRKWWVGGVLGVMVIGLFGFGLGVSIFGMRGGPRKLWVNGAMYVPATPQERAFAMKTIREGFNLMSSWGIVGTVVDACITATIVAAMLKYHKQTLAIDNMDHVRNTLRRGTLYLVESMFLPLASQIVHASIMRSGIGLSQGLRALMAVRLPLHAFAVIWSLLSRSELQAIYKHKTGATPVPNSSAGGVTSVGSAKFHHQKEWVPSARSPTAPRQDVIELDKYASSQPDIADDAQHDWPEKNVVSRPPVLSTIYSGRVKGDERGSFPVSVADSYYFKTNNNAVASAV